VATPKIEVTGLRALIDALGETDKKAVKAIQTEIKDVSEQVVTNAQGRIGGLPLSGWGAWNNRGRDLGFDMRSVVTGIKVQANRFRKRGVNRGFGYDVAQSNAAGSVYEVVGSGDSPFVQNIVDRSGTARPRTLLPAYYSAVTPEVQERIKDKITDEARKAGLV
jgi:hypothetical protein